MPETTGMFAEVEVQVHPRSHRAHLGFVGEVLHVWVTAPPVEGAANAAVVALVAERVGVARSRVSIVRGSAARHKRLCIQGISPADLRARLGNAAR
jgi:uncharacterized protein (TIGR00251 family)